jgi:cytochrome c oxidase assembly factor CtaG
MNRGVILALLVGSAAAYVVGWWRLGRRAGRPLATRRLAMAMAAIAALATALVSPLDRLAHERFSAHMVQHLILLTLAAPLALLGNPFPVMVWALPARARVMLRPLFARHGVLRPWLRTLTGMPIAWVIFAGTIWLWHLPALYDRAVDDEVVHALEHAALLGAALVFWWPLLQPAPHVRGKPHPGAAIVYVVLAGFQSAALGLGLMLWPTVLYTPYARGGPSALEDQAWGGILMWTVSGVVDMAIVMALVWRFLAAGERARGHGFLDPPRLMRED